MTSKRNVNILADQHHSASIPPFHQPAYTTGPPLLSPVTAPTAHQNQHPPQSLPPVSALSNPPQSRYQPQPPPPPPLLHTVSSQTHEGQDKQEHGYNGPHSGHATPIIRNHGEPPYQRTSSTPVPNQGPPQPPLERNPMENGHPQPLYAAGPPHPDHHMMYPPPQHHPGPPPMMEHGYAPHPAYPPPPPPPPQGYLYPNMHMANQNTRKKSMRASQVGKLARQFTNKH